MTIQSDINAFSGDTPAPQIEDPPERPSDDELEHLIAPNWMYDFDVNEVNGINKLRQDIRDATFADDPVEEWSHILKRHISDKGNGKIAKGVAMFNIGSAHDCPNIGTKHCQVDEEDCYAARSEKNFPGPLSARRRELIIWDHLDAKTFAEAFRRYHQRKRTPVTELRMNESGDFRNTHDVYKFDEIARRISDIVDVYTYSASEWLPWNDTDEGKTWVLNASNQLADYGTRNFIVVKSKDQIPEGALRCPHDVSGGEVKCGECRLCIDADAPDIYVLNQYSEEGQGGGHTTD